MEKYILSLDQGTTSSRAILFNEKGKSSIPPKRNSHSISLNQAGSNITPMRFGGRSWR